MTALLTVLFGRLPIGWLQLVHNRTRLAAAIAGVAFATILIFMQLGFMGALNESTVLPYRALTADILLSASDSNTLSDGGNVPRQRMFQALATPGVANAAALYIGKTDWELENGNTVNLQVFGFNPDTPVFDVKPVGTTLDRLNLADTAIVDRTARNVDPLVIAAVEAGNPQTFETNGRTLTIIGTFAIGGGFEADGYLIVSDQTFLRLFPQRTSGAPSRIAVQVEPGIDVNRTVERLRSALSAKDTTVRTIEAAAARDQTYQTTERPVGVVFGFGVIIGVLVGIVIVYQVLSTDVADHLSEYATLKAVGYRQRFFLGVVFEEAIILALFGFVPGILISLGLYEIVSSATGLPVVMTAARPFGVFFGMLAMCIASGAIATRRLAGADPADLF